MSVKVKVEICVDILFLGDRRSFFLFSHKVLISESCSEHSICSVEEIMMRMIKRPREIERDETMLCVLTVDYSNSH